MKIVNNGLTIEINGALGHFPKEFVVSVLEKQIPKKCMDGFHKEKFIDGRCPACSFRQSKGDIEWKRQFNKYCRNCGQALDWSDTE